MIHTQRKQRHFIEIIVALLPFRNGHCGEVQRKISKRKIIGEKRSIIHTWMSWRESPDKAILFQMFTKPKRRRIIELAFGWVLVKKKNISCRFKNLLLQSVQIYKQFISFVSFFSLHVVWTYNELWVRDRMQYSNKMIAYLLNNAILRRHFFLSCRFFSKNHTHPLAWADDKKSKARYI